MSSVFSRNLSIVIAFLFVLATVIFVVLRRPETEIDPAAELQGGQQPSTPALLRIGYLPIAASLPLFVADTEHSFRNAGFDAELIQFSSSNELAVAAVSGQIDLAVSCAVSTMLDAQSIRPANVKAFMLNSYSKTGSNGKPTDYLISQRDFASVAELKGKTIAFFPGSVSRVFAEICLPRLGLLFSEIKFVELPPGQWAVAMKNRTIDAVAAIEPYGSALIRDGDYNVLVEGFFETALPNVPISASWINVDQFDLATQGRIVGVLESSVISIRESPSSAVESLVSRSEIDLELAKSIGLNNWLFTSNQDARHSAVEFVKMLQQRDLSKPQRSDDDWLWTR